MPRLELDEAVQSRQLTFCVADLPVDLGLCTIKFDAVRIEFEALIESGQGRRVVVLSQVDVRFARVERVFLGFDGDRPVEIGERAASSPFRSNVKARAPKM